MNKNPYSSRPLCWDFQSAQVTLGVILGSWHSSKAQTWLSVLETLEVEGRCVVTSPLPSPYYQKSFHEGQNSMHSINSCEILRHLSGRKTQVLSGLSGGTSLNLSLSLPIEIWSRSDKGLRLRKSKLSKCHIGVVKKKCPREHPCSFIIHLTFKTLMR